MTDTPTPEPLSAEQIAKIRATFADADRFVTRDRYVQINGSFDGSTIARLCDQLAEAEQRIATLEAELDEAPRRRDLEQAKADALARAMIVVRRQLVAMAEIAGSDEGMAVTQLADRAAVRLRNLHHQVERLTAARDEWQRRAVTSERFRAEDAATHTDDQGVTFARMKSAEERVAALQVQVETLTAQRDEWQEETIICAAVLLPDGYIVRGHRHHDALRSALGMERAKGLKGSELPQGFMTSRGRFIDRKEARRLVDGQDGPLFSEDVY
jgi:hypothetical protein